MKSLVRQFTASAVPALLGTGLLVVLAVLQMRWTGELSRAERQRLETRLSEKLEGFARDFDREITRVYYAFRPVRVDSAYELGPFLARQYRHWLASAPYPELVESVWLAEESAAPLRLNPRKLGFERAGRLESGPLILRWPIGLGRRGEVLVNLSAGGMAGHLVPALARRYFYAGERPEYDLLIAGNGAPALTLYQSHTALSDFTPDGSILLLRIRSEEVVWAAPAPAPPVPPAPPASGSPFAALKPPATPEQPVAFESAERSRQGRLRLLVRHRAGSLDAAAAVAYRSSRAISIGALVLLAAGMAQLLIANGRARRLTRQQLEFVAGVSHELRTPLAILRSAGENLADGVAGNGDAQTREYGILIRTEARRLAGMIEQLLEYAGMRSGRKRYALQPIHLAAVVDQAIERSLPLVKEAGMELEKHLPETLPLVLGDAAALRSALENLISNAVKYAASGKWVAVDVYVDGRQVEIAVTDRGTGVPAADRRRIFEPFERGSGVLNSRVRGAGIGLSLVKQIAAAHGGRISLRSAPDRGSRFTLHLPLPPEADNKEKP